MEKIIDESDCKLYKADAFDLMSAVPDRSIECVITDPPYESMNKHREVGTTTRLGGHREADKRTGWFNTITNEELYTCLCEIARVLKKNSHAWICTDNETQAIVQGFIREGDTGFTYVKSYPVIKLRTDGQAPKMGGGYHLKATHEYVVLCEKGRRRWAETKAEHLARNNRPDYFQVPWIGNKESRLFTPDGEPYDTAKPVSLMRQLVELSSFEGETIFEPFAGSGSTIEAALTLNRKVIACDTSDHAINTCRNRIAHLSESKLQGHQAALRHAGDGDARSERQGQPAFTEW